MGLCKLPQVESYNIKYLENKLRVRCKGEGSLLFNNFGKLSYRYVTIVYNFSSEIP